MDLERGGLRAKKSWFYFDEEFVALGAGISSPTNNAVFTSVNQSHLRGEVRTSNQTAPLAAGQHDAIGARWLWHDETGYIFPPESPLRLSNQTRNGRWSDIGGGSEAGVSHDVFSLYFDHGARPQGASYEYIVVPNVSAQNLNARLLRSGLLRSGVETLSNTADIQAVRHRDLGIVQAVFHRAGGLNGGAGWNLKVDVPCLVMVRETADGAQITVSNPQNEPLSVHLEIDRKLSGDGAKTGGNGTTFRFELPGGLMAGSSVVRVFKWN